MTNDSDSKQNDSISFDVLGYYKGQAANRYDVPRQSGMQSQGGTIILKKKMMYEQALEDLKGFERLWIVYQFHLNPTHWKPKVNPPRNPDRKKKGVFATRAPYRPNPIGMSCVKLKSVKGLKIEIEESDLLDGSPILDIKPYISYADSFPNSNAGWLEGIEKHSYSINWTPEAIEQQVWLDKKTTLGFKEFVERNLEYQPLNTRHKRVRQIGPQGTYSIALRSWRIRFQIKEENQEAIILGFNPGWTEDPQPEHNELHQEFEKHFPSPEWVKDENRL